jgi:hypothetical protein
VKKLTCEKHRHRTHGALAHCLWRGAEWIDGTGPYALRARCRAFTVTLWPSRQEAEREKDILDAKCGGGCWENHDIVRLTLNR